MQPARRHAWSHSLLAYQAGLSAAAAAAAWQASQRRPREDSLGSHMMCILIRCNGATQETVVIKHSASWPPHAGLQLLAGAPVQNLSACARWRRSANARAAARARARSAGDCGCRGGHRSRHGVHRAGAWRGARGGGRAAAGPSRWALVRCPGETVRATLWLCLCSNMSMSENSSDWAVLGELVYGLLFCFCFPTCAWVQAAWAGCVVAVQALVVDMHGAATLVCVSK